jgi:hypothetical protein
MRTAVLLPLAVLLAAAPALARPPHPGPHGLGRVDRACRRDARDLCRDRDRDESVTECLLASREHLSEDCRAALAAPRLTRDDLRECRDDTAEYCRHQRGTRLSVCLVDHKADLERNCREVVDQAQRDQGLLPDRKPAKPKKEKAPKKGGKKGGKKAKDDDAGDAGDDDGTAGDDEAGDAPER